MCSLKSWIQQCILNFPVINESTDRKTHSRMWACHESANEGLKIFNVVRHILRRDIPKRACWFYAFEQLIAFALDGPDPQFDYSLLELIVNTVLRLLPFFSLERAHSLFIQLSFSLWSKIPATPWEEYHRELMLGSQLMHILFVQATSRLFGY